MCWLFVWRISTHPKNIDKIMWGSGVVASKLRTKAVRISMILRKTETMPTLLVTSALPKINACVLRPSILNGPTVWLNCAVLFEHAIETQYNSVG